MVLTGQSIAATLIILSTKHYDAQQLVAVISTMVQFFYYDVHLP